MQLLPPSAPLTSKNTPLTSKHVLQFPLSHIKYTDVPLVSSTDKYLPLGTITTHHGPHIMSLELLNRTLTGRKECVPEHHVPTTATAPHTPNHTGTPDKGEVPGPPVMAVEYCVGSCSADCSVPEPNNPVCVRETKLGSEGVKSDVGNSAPAPLEAIFGKVVGVTKLP